MKNAAALIVAFIIVWIAWGILGHLIGSLVMFAVSLAAIALFCYLVYTVYKLLTREKQIM